MTLSAKALAVPQEAGKAAKPARLRALRRRWTQTTSAPSRSLFFLGVYVRVPYFATLALLIVPLAFWKEGPSARLRTNVAVRPLLQGKRVQGIPGKHSRTLFHLLRHPPPYVSSQLLSRTVTFPKDQPTFTYLVVELCRLFIDTRLVVFSKDRATKQQVPVGLSVANAEDLLVFRHCYKKQSPEQKLSSTPFSASVSFAELKKFSLKGPDGEALLLVG